MKNQDLELYMDYVIVESILTNPNLIKQAQFSNIAQTLFGKITEYVGAHIDPNNKTHSVINILAPVGIRTLLGALGMPTIGFILAVLTSVFHFDIASILESIFNKIKPLISSDSQIHPQEISSIVSSEVNKYNTPPTQEEFEKSKQIRSQSFNKQIRDAKLVKLSISSNNLTKVAGLFGTLASYSTGKPMFAGVLIRILSFIFKVILGSAGFMVVGDLFNKMRSAPNALDKTLKDNKPTNEPQIQKVPEAKQTKFPIKSHSNQTHNTATDFWAEDYSNNEQGITQMLLDFTDEIYDKVDNSIVVNTPSFKALVDDIEFYNHNTPKDKKIVFIPKAFHSKKEIVDLFIDYVAARSP